MHDSAPSPAEQLARAYATKKSGGMVRAKWKRDSRGRNHPSGEEADWFDAMYAREARGEFVIVEIEPSWPIRIKAAGDATHDAPTFLCNVKADLSVRMPDGRVRFLDYKGRKGDTAVSRLKHKMVAIQHGIAIELVGKYVERKAKAKAKAKAERDLLKRAGIKRKR